MKLLFLQKGRRVIVQNPDDLAALRDSGTLKLEHLKLVRGSGVDIEEFSPEPVPDPTVPIVILAARMRDTSAMLAFAFILVVRM